MPNIKQIYRGLYKEIREKRNEYFEASKKKYQIGQRIEYNGENYFLLNFWPDLKRKEFPMEFQYASIMGKIQKGKENPIMIELENEYTGTTKNVN